MLSDDAATEAVVFGEQGILAGLAKGGIHIAMSTISEALSARLTVAHQEAGHYFVAAPVLGRPDAAAAGKLFVAVAGPSAAIERVRPVLEKIGQRITVVGETPAQGHLLKLIANFMISSVLESLGESTALAQKGGIAPEAMMDFLTNSIFSAPLYKTYGPIIANQTFVPVGFALPLGQKDNRLVLQSAETHQVPMPFASVVRDRFLSARAQGYDDLDWSANDARRLVFQPAGGRVHAGVYGLLDRRARGPGHGGRVLVGDMVHRVGTERDQVLRHLRLPCPGGLLRPCPDS